MNLKDAILGTRIAYIPTHAGGNIEHKDVEYGEISSVNAYYIFVKFDGELNSKACLANDLRKI